MRLFSRPYRPSKGWRKLGAAALAFFVMWGATPAAQAQQPNGSPPPQGERFFISIPDGWKEVIRTRQQGADVIAYVPKEQNATQWTDMLTIQVFQGMNALPAQSFYDRSTASYKKACETVRIGQMQSGASNGYPSAFWVLACGMQLQSGSGETAFFRLIQGNNALYMAQRTWRTVRFDAQSGASPVTEPASQMALQTLKSFGICDPSTPKNPCPSFQ